MKRFKNRTGGDVFKQSISGIENYYEFVQKNALSSCATLSPTKLIKDTPYEVIRTHLKFLYAQHQAKYAELTGALIDSVNNKEYLLFALCGRSLLELTAMLRFYIKKLEPVIRKTTETGIVTHEQQKLIIDILDSQARGGRFNWIEFYAGNRVRFAEKLVEARKKKGGKDVNQNSATALDKITPKQVNVLTTIEQWGKDVPLVSLAYEYFCELVHPNVGNNFLVMGSKSGTLVIGKSSTKNVARSFCEEGIPMIASTAIREGSLCMSVLLLLKEMGDPLPLPKAPPPK